MVWARMLAYVTGTVPFAKSSSRWRTVVGGEQEKVRCRERLGGLLKYYAREAA
jgi:hypothetical protein